MSRTHACALVLAAVACTAAGCGLTLDYDPPTVRDAGFDARLADAGRPRDAGPRDAGSIECRTSAECDDGAACNGAELCVEGACVPGEPIACDDADACNGSETCVEGGCVTMPIDCASDGDPCNGEESCDAALGCVTSGELDCDDAVPCTHDSCAAPDGCRHEPDDALCTDGPAGRCTPDGCQYSVCNTTTCTAGPCQTAACSGTTCVRTDLCDGGTRCCAGACVTPGCDDGDPCTADSCGGDGCLHAPVTGPSCSDGNGCTLGDRCNAGSCVSGGTVSCGDGNPCTYDICEPASGACLALPNSGAPCDDGDLCTAGDVCRDGACTPGLGVTFCTSPGPCVSSSCDSLFGCVDVPLPPGTACGVDRFCTAAGTCECRIGTADCDRDGSCECDGRCDSGGTCTNGCTGDADCGGTQLCCPSAFGGLGYCYDEICLSCCMISPTDAGSEAGVDSGTATTSPDAGT